MAAAFPLQVEQISNKINRLFDKYSFSQAEQQEIKSTFWSAFHYKFQLELLKNHRQKLGLLNDELNEINSKKGENFAKNIITLADKYKLSQLFISVLETTFTEFESFFPQNTKTPYS